MTSIFRNIAINSILVLVLIVFLINTSLFKDSNNGIYDFFTLINTEKTSKNSIVIIKIDEESIEKLGIWPLKRKIYADLLDVIFKGKPKVVGFYFDFVMPSDKENDEEFLLALSKYPTVVLDPFTFEIKETENNFWREVKKYSHLGHDILRSDKDGTIRNHSPILNNKVSFPLSILNIYNSKKFSYNPDSKMLIINKDKYENVINKKIPVNFKHPWYSFKSYSLAEVLNYKVSSSVFKDKIVLVGMTKKGLTDYYTTPLSKKLTFTGKVAPIYLQAQVIDGLLSYNTIKIFDYRLFYILLVIYIPLLIALIRNFGVVKQIILVVIILSLVELCLSFVFFKFFNFWFSPVFLIFTNLLVCIVTAIMLNINVSSFLDSYIRELKTKQSDENSLKVDPSVDDKLVTLKEITGLIEKDRFILDTVLSSVRSTIFLFDQNGNVIYSNDKNHSFDMDKLKEEICLSKIIDETNHEPVIKKFLTVKNKQYELIVNKAKENLYTGVFNDITEITKINETKSIIMRMLSHEMKTPLTTILLCCDFLISYNQNNKLNNYIDKITDQTEFLRDLISNFLELNKLEISEFQLDKEYIDIESLVKSVIESFSIITNDKNINIEMITRIVDKVNILGDTKYLIILFKNLLDNAIKYSPKDTTITVIIDRVEQTVEISIKDEGYGIDEKDLNHLFKKFYRIKNEKTETISGTGLGLSFVKKVIELHEGNINVKSTLNKGSEFIVSLPVDLNKG